MGAQPAGPIFVSYRRKDTAHVAGRIADRLIAHLPDRRVFLDVDSVGAGADFVEAVTNAVLSSDVVLVLIGDKWRGDIDESGRSRLDTEDDLIRLELVTALTNEIPIIPLLVDGASMPTQHDLPDPMKALARRNAVRLDYERFDQDITRLLGALDGILSRVVATPRGPKEASDPRDRLERTPRPKPQPDKHTQTGGPAPQGNVHTSPLSTRARPSAALSRRLILTALIVVIASAGIFLALRTSGDPAPRTTPAQPSAVVTPAPTYPTFSETRTIRTAPNLLDVKVDGGSLLISTESGHLQRVEAVTGNQTSFYDFGLQAGLGMVLNGGDVAVPLTWSGAIGFVDSGFAKQSQTLAQTGPGQCRNGIAVADGFWFACHTKTAGFLLHMSGRKEAPGGRLVMPSHPFGLVANGDFLYVTFSDQDSVGKYNLKTNKMITAHIPGNPVSAALVDGNLWVTVSGNDEVAVLDPDTLAEKTRYGVGDEPWKIAVGLGSVWITNRSKSVPNQLGTVSRLDPATGQRQQDDIRVGVQPDELAVGPDAIYVGNEGDSSISVIKSS
jgi:YVTN family beta-propeller protein